MKRLYFLLPSPNSACQTVNELMAGGVHTQHIHALANYENDLPCTRAATLFQTTELGRGLGLGFMVGGLAGLLGGGLVALYPPPSLVIGMWGLILCGSFGALLGVIIGGLLAKDRLKPDILPYEGAILRGSVLLIVDASSKAIKTITDLVRIHHPEAIPKVKDKN